MIIDIMMRIVSETKRLIPALSDFEYIELFGNTNSTSPKPIKVTKSLKGDVAYHFGDNKQNHGFVRILDQPKYHFDQQRSIGCGSLNGSLTVDLPIRFLLGFYHKSPYIIEQAFLEFLSLINLQNIANASNVKIYPTNSYIFSDEAYKAELQDLKIDFVKLNKNLTCFVVDCDLSYRWGYNECTPIDLCQDEVCCDGNYILFNGAQIAQTFQFGDVLNFSGLNDSNDTLCDLGLIPFLTDTWLAGTLNDFLKNYVNNLTYVGSAIEYIEITDRDNIVFHLKPEAKNCCGRTVSIAINSFHPGNLIFYSEITCC